MSRIRQTGRSASSGRNERRRRQRRGTGSTQHDFHNSFFVYELRMGGGPKPRRAKDPTPRPQQPQTPRTMPETAKRKAGLQSASMTRTLQTGAPAAAPSAEASPAEPPSRLARSRRRARAQQPLPPPEPGATRRLNTERSSTHDQQVQRPHGRKQTEKSAT